MKKQQVKNIKQERDKTEISKEDVILWEQILLFNFNKTN